MAKKWGYLFDEMDQALSYGGGDWEAVLGLLGSKGANLAEMVRLGIAVPPGYIVTTEACNACLAAGGSKPEGLWEQAQAALKAIEEAVGKKLGDPKNLLLASCRSGAKFSMPGMMDNVLNIGLDDENSA